jgi:trans-aconitate 2-methyltransferase
MAWSAAQYVMFEDERTRPARDLVAQAAALLATTTPGAIFDLGCGPGNSTALLIERFPGKQVVGIDNDPDMLAAARRRLPAVPFLQGDLAFWEPPSPAAMLLANAVLQWMPDPLETIARLAGTLSPGGVLAVQMPDNLDEPTHRAMREVAALPDIAPFYAGGLPNRQPVPAPSTLIDRLSPLSISVDVWHTVYHHRLAGPEAIVEWVKGTGLRPWLEPLPPEARDLYLATYLARIRAAYPPLDSDGVLLRFPRLFLTAVRR